MPIKPICSSQLSTFKNQNQTFVRYPLFLYSPLRRSMFCSQHQQLLPPSSSSSVHHHHQGFTSLHLHRNPNTNTITTTFLPFTITNRIPKPSISSSLNHHNETHPPKIEEEDENKLNHEEIHRRHNARSTSFLLRRLSRQNQSGPKNPEEEEEEEVMSEGEKVRLLELSMVRRRPPQFPGSIYLKSYNDVQTVPSIPPLNRLLPGGDADVDDDKIIRQALEIRRNVTSEIFKACMRSKKFSINYSNSMVSVIPDFIDHVMIEAASMKSLPEYSHSTFNARAKTYIHSSDIVPLIRWLKHNSMTYPQIGKLICKSYKNLQNIRDLVMWLKKIYVKGEFLGVVLVKAGRGIFERSLDELDEMVEYLESNGIRKEWMGYVVSRCPKIISYTMEEVRSRVSFYTDMGVNKKDFGTMVFDCSKAFGHFTLEEMHSKVNFLKEFGLSHEDVGRLLAFKPQLMSCSIERRWKPLVKYLYYLGVRRDGMKRMLLLKPMVFCVDLETTIAPKVRFFQDIGIQEDSIGHMLVKFPPVLTYSLYKKIRPVVVFLLTAGGVSQRDIGKVVALAPELLGCSIVKKLDVNVKYLLSLGIHHRLLGVMIADFPMLLRYSLDILRPKYRYLRRTMVRPVKDLIEFPRFFSYSLEGRIIPRHKVMVENRVNFKLRYMLATSDDDFKQRVEAAVEKRRKFEAGIIEDPLSDSQATDNVIEKTEVDHSRREKSEDIETPEQRRSLWKTSSAKLM